MRAPEPAVGPSALLAGLLPAGVAVMETWADGDPATLSPAERVHIGRARPGRAREFAAGRLCARQALERLGRAGWDLLVAPDRSPQWPPGIAGSISHTTGYCCAAVCEQDRFRSIGLDVEIDRRVTADLHGQFLTASEQAALLGMSDNEAGRRATLIFSAKEAFYKCQYPLTSEWLDFADIEVEVPDDLREAGRLTIRPTRRLAIEQPFPAPWHGRFVRFRGLVATGFVVPDAGDPQRLR